MTIGGRNLARAGAAATSLQHGAGGIAVDVADGRSCAAALVEHAVVINCAGPFEQLDAALAEACIDCDCHYVDIAENRGYFAAVQKLGPQFAERGLTAAVGCSCLPGISGALALYARHDNDAAVDHVRVTLFIGNSNPKGRAAVSSAAQQVGRSIRAPQGELIGFRGSETVPLPPPFGRRRVRNFDSPEYDLFAELLGAKSVTVKVGFELRLVTASFGMFAAFAPGLGRAVLPRLAASAGWLRGIGCSGGAVMAEVFFADGTVRSAAIAGRSDGQILAALPAVYAAERLARDPTCRRGAVTAYELVGAEGLIEQLAADSFELHETAALE